MNRIYRVVWNHNKKTWQAASEICRRRQGASGAGGAEVSVGAAEADRSRVWAGVGLALIWLPLSPAAMANQCTTIAQNSITTCTIDENQTGNLVIAYNAGGTDYTVTNQASQQRTLSLAYDIFGLQYRIDGGTPSRGGHPAGYPGGTLTVDNQAPINIGWDGTGSTNFPEYIYGINAKAYGSPGVEPDDQGADGGRGGDGGVITINNRSAITIDGNADFGGISEVVGVLARSQGADGGPYNEALLGDQLGGNGGDAKAITIDNEAAITIGSQSDAFVGSDLARVISAEGVGGNGAYGADGKGQSAAGGAGSTIDITNRGDLALFYQENGTGLHGIQGIFALSLGGDGSASEDNTDPGGKGEPGRVITIDNSADIDIVNSGMALAGESAAIYALSIGGQGGRSPDSNRGGVGGGGSTTTEGGDGVLFVSQSGGAITTQGVGIRGIVARSEGGAGGDGNGASGSTGGNGGFGGDIQIDFTGGAQIDTADDEGYGILAQSVGGIGGVDAGTAGKGGNAGSVGVYATSASSIETHGDYAAGIALHSVGGGGGTGDDFVGVLFGSGGNGGNGGSAEKVTTTSGADITTHGDHAYGFLAQAVGGSGGTGGIGAGVISLGGNAGGGGAAADVEQNNSGDIVTSGDYSIGILAQSIAGGGGAAGASGGVLSVGGAAGAGANNWQTAYVTHSGDITTSGDAASGIVAQAIGGGGGIGGGAAGMAAVGGSGSSGGQGGKAEIFAVGGTIHTAGDHAYGLAAQSIGGGGGNGGDVFDASVLAGVGIGGSGDAGGNGLTACATNTYEGCDGVPVTTAPNGSVADTGSAASQSDDGSVIRTEGDFSHGVIVQSIGGGGGNGGSVDAVSAFSIATLQVGGGGSVGGAGGEASGYFDALQLSTSGQNAKGMIVQSLGGGGGNGGSTMSLNIGTPLAIQIGGSGGSGTSGGKSSLTLIDSLVTTAGANAGAVLVQSIGGGGGTGGSATGYDASLGLTLNNSLGGSGGTGSTADQASVSLTDTRVQTGFDDESNPLGVDAASSHGITVQSIGGGGGTGGSAVADAFSLAAPTGEGESFAVAVSTTLGGSSGDGGNGGSAIVSLDGTSTIITGGDGAHGILAQSIGGGGGDGGSASSLAGTVGLADTASIDVATALGAPGGSGGSGGAVDVALADSAHVETYGDNANAIVAQSIGGGGGDGGIGNSDNKQVGGGITVKARIGLGGSGGKGGVGHDVDISLASGTSVATHGSGARGIVAQSIGGGGGTGQGGTIGFDASFSLGGEGEGEGEGEGGNAGEVASAEDAGGNDSSEDSGDPTEITPGVNLNVGAAGGSGNLGGDITSDGGINGSVTTQGGDADGVLLQSIGGGGGLAGSAGSDIGDADGSSDDDSGQEDSSDEEPMTFSLSAAIGGKGGSSGHGGDIGGGGDSALVFNTTVITQGDWADGIVLQSIGGGGGAGGTALAAGSAAKAELSMAVGGQGGAGGDGGVVNTFLSGNGGRMSVNTAGYAAHGILLQSIGGGGGQSGDGSDSANGKISIGGGFGASGGAAGNGGNVSIGSGSFSFVTTRGDDAYGIFAQSIGGGGGMGGAGSTTQSDERLDLDLEVAVGGRGGASGNGGDVDLSLGTTLKTLGDRAFGIVAQSIGGGGGIGGAASTDSLLSVELGTQEANGASGNGGQASVDVTSGSIATTGEGAHAIIAQSVGGGGGIAGNITGNRISTQRPGFGGDDGPSGDGGRVSVTTNANVTTTGDGAYGIIAQSIGGGGGLYGGADGILHAGATGNSTGTAGDVVVDQTGRVFAQGNHAYGIFAQSMGAEYNGNIIVNVNGQVIGGTGDGVGVNIDEGYANVLNIAESGSVSGGGETGTAVVYNTASSYLPTLAIHNDGVIYGDIRFYSPSTDNPGGIDGSGTVSAARVPTTMLLAAPARGIYLDNGVGATWLLREASQVSVVNAGTVGVLGNANDVTSAGNVATLTGDFEQTESGRLRIAADFEQGTADRLDIDGDATLDGQVEVISATLAPTLALDVLRVSGTTTGALDAADTPAVDFMSEVEDGVTRIRVSDTRFASAFDGLDENQQAVGERLDALYDDGATNGFAALLGQVNALSANADGGESYADGLASMSMGSAQAIAAAQTLQTSSWLDDAMSCGERAGSVVSESDGNCFWAGVADADISQDGIGGYHGDIRGVGFGGQIRVAPDLTLGFTAGGGDADLDGRDGLSKTDGTSGYAGVSLTRDIGNLALSAGLTGSYGEYDTERHIRIPAFDATAEGTTDIATVGARLRAAYTASLGAAYLKPKLDLDLIHVRASGYDESGAGILDLEVEDERQTALITTPALEFGAGLALSPAWTVAGFGEAGVSFSSADDWKSHADFKGAESNSRFSSTVSMPGTLAKYSAGISLANDSGFEARLEYRGASGDGYESDGGFLKLVKAF